MTAVNELRAGVVGTGFIGGVHVEALRRLGVAVAGVVGSTPARGAQAAARWGLPSHDSYESLLADAAVDVVHITTPNDRHFEQAKAALLAGKHVVCEKPLAMTSEETGELVEKSSYQAYGNPDSDYRPARWSGFRFLSIRVVQG